MSWFSMFFETCFCSIFSKYDLNRASRKECSSSRCSLKGACISQAQIEATRKHRPDAMILWAVKQNRFSIVCFSLFVSDPDQFGTA
jgi:hypothetical protein